LFKAVLSDPEHAAAHLRAVLPAEVLARVDLSELRAVPGSFVDEGLAQRHADLLLEARVEGAPVLLYLLLEHQSTECREMSLRLLGYVLRIWERWRAEHGGAEGLPVVLPLVLYHGTTRWSAPRRLRDLLWAPAEAREVFGPFCPDFEYLLHDLSQVEDEAVAGTALGRLTLLLMKHARDGDLGRRLPGWAGDLREVHARSGLRGVRLVLEYVLKVAAGVERGDWIALVRGALPPEAEEDAMTLAEQLFAEGREEGLRAGRAQGREEGREEGRLQGQRRQLARLLKVRFGGLPAWAVEGVGGGAAEDWALWGERLFCAEGVAEIFAK